MTNHWESEKFFASHAVISHSRCGMLDNGPIVCGQTVILISFCPTGLRSSVITCHTSFVDCKNTTWLFTGYYLASVTFRKQNCSITLGHFGILGCLKTTELISVGADQNYSGIVDPVYNWHPSPVIQLWITKSIDWNMHQRKTNANEKRSARHVQTKNKEDPFYTLGLKFYRTAWYHTCWATTSLFVKLKLAHHYLLIIPTQYWSLLQADN